MKRRLRRTLVSGPAGQQTLGSDYLSNRRVGCRGWNEIGDHTCRAALIDATWSLARGSPLMPLVCRGLVLSRFSGTRLLHHILIFSQHTLNPPACPELVARSCVSCSRSDPRRELGPLVLPANEPVYLGWPQLVHSDTVEEQQVVVLCWCAS